MTVLAFTFFASRAARTAPISALRELISIGTVLVFYECPKENQGVMIFTR